MSQTTLSQDPSRNPASTKPGSASTYQEKQQKPLQEDAKQAASEAKHSMADTLAAQRDELHAKAEQAKEAAAQKAKEASRYVRNKSCQVIQSRQQKVGDQFETFASAIDQAGDKIREGSDPRLAEWTDSATRKLRNSADYLKNSEPAKVADDVRGLARQYPELVFGGLFVLGLAAARFLKTSDDDQDELQDGNSTYASHPGNPRPATAATVAQPSSRTTAPPSAAVQAK